MDSFSIVALLDGISDVEDEEQLKPLDEATQHIQVNAPPEVVQAFLRVFERFPEDDGFGVFWSVLHALETVEGYEIHLIDSVRRQPSEFGITMVNRLANSGVKTVETHNLKELLIWLEKQSDVTSNSDENN